jgi:hypothetical protein
VAPEGTALLVVALPSSPTCWFQRRERSATEKVIIGVDPHRLSATIEVVDDRERMLGFGSIRL